MTKSPHQSGYHPVLILARVTVLAVVVPDKAEAPEETRRCTKCGAIVRWSDLTPIGIQRFPDGPALEMATHAACGTTMARELPEVVDTEVEPTRLSEPPPSERPIGRAA